MADFDRPKSPYDNLKELAAKARRSPSKQTPPIDPFEFNSITFQFDDLQAPATTPLLISAPPPKPRRAIITPPRFSLDERLNALRPVTYGDPKPSPAPTNGARENKTPASDEPQTAALRLHNDIANTISNLKPVHSEAKSSFFGLNGTPHRNRSDLSPNPRGSNSTADSKPLLPDRKIQPLLAQAPPPVVMRRLRDTLPAPKKPRFSRDSLEPDDAGVSDLDSSNRNSKANSSASSSSTDRTVTPNTTLLSLLVADAQQNQVVSNNNNANDTSPKSARFALSENGTRKAGDGVDGGKRNSMGEKRLSQLDPNQQTPVYMTTTVPQNIKGINIMGRHKPTRTSLRHSRMIVINKNFQSQQKNSLNIKCGILARIFLILQIIVGVALVAMGLYLLVWAPHTRMRDNPYWSGIMLVLSGILGLYLLAYKRTPLHRMKENFFLFLKINAAVILCCTIFFTMLAFIYASIHYHSLSVDDKECVPENVFTSGSSCICVFHNSHLRFIESESNRNATSSLAKLKSSAPDDSDGVEVHYRDMSCNEVLGVWVYILLVSSLLNLLGLIFSVAYMLQFALGCRKRPQPKYLSVPMRQSAV